MADDAARQKWDARYRNSAGNLSSIADVLRQHQQLLPPKGVTLELACGLGANALFLAGKGLEVHAWDISPVAIEKLTAEAKRQGLTLHTEVRDCIAQPPAVNRFDLIIVSRFLARDLCPAISAALRSGGLLFYQTYTRARQATQGPHNPQFLLSTGELLSLFRGLEVIHYSERDEALLVARKP